MSSSICRRLHGIIASIAPAASGTAITASKQAKPSTTPNKPTNPKLQKLQKLANEFKKSSNNSKFRCRISYYESTVNRFAAAKKFSLIEDILEHQKQFEDIKDERFVVRLISLYGKARMFDHAQKLFDEMSELDCKRTVISFNALLAACINSKKIDKIEDLIRELPGKLGIQPDIITYNTLIKSLCIKGSMDLGLEVIKSMQSNGVEPNLITFNTLLDGFYRKNEMSRAEKVWELMKSGNLVADVRSYNPKLRALATNSRVSEAVDLIEEMRAAGVKPDIYSFNALIQGYCIAKNLEHAKRWYEELAKCNVAPDRVTFEIILPFVCEMGDFHYAFQLCKEVMNTRHRVSVSVIQSVIDGLVKDLNTAEAQELVDLGKKNNYFHYKLKLSTEEE